MARDSLVAVMNRVDRMGGKMEAASGFEPLHRGFADLSLNHLGTPPSLRCNINFRFLSRLAEMIDNAK